MGTLRKYLMNGAIISSVLSGVSAYRQGRKNPTDWRTYLTWIAWALTLIVALGTVRKDSIDPSAPRVAAGPKLSNPKKKAKKDKKDK
ncbi:hypothetical protein [Amnibacterium setariae]|uniref:Uncharacterized protein n=1 Tax=Amnibacterium setariae TaxID=2306585 RepID=A0A3A1TY38_9MICO|nr:hypothetical protein [Amnibacterium setariae]RIX28719.1 hypothetical protein D1781_15115 [Amnibacterium setariae]